MSKYMPLADYLRSRSENSWRPHFEEIERILGFDLPPSARKYTAWWGNQEPYASQTHGWLGVGWKTSDLDLGDECVTFERVGNVCPKAQTLPISSVIAPTVAPEAGPKSSRRYSVSATENNNPHEWDLPDQLNFGVCWKPIGRLSFDDQGKLVFPKAESLAGLYRFTVKRDNQLKRYIGETDNIQRRFAHYRNPGPSQKTNLRLNKLFLEELQMKAEIAVAIFTGAAMLDLGEGPIPIDMGRKSVRRMLENSILVHHYRMGIELLNLGED